jgi:hypothetical protein
MPLDLGLKLVRDRGGRLLLLGLVALYLAGAGPAGAQNLTGTWGMGDGTGLAKCRAVLVDGTSVSSEYTLGPLEITQSGTAIYVRSLERALHYQGVVHLTGSGAGSAIATSCAAITATAADVPGTFHFSKATPLKNTIKGSFVGRWQTTGEIISCKFSATRASTSDPMIAACP